MSHIHVLSSNPALREAAEEALRQDYFLSSYSSAQHLDSSISHREVDLLLIDSRIDEGDGHALLRDLVLRHPSLRVLAFVANDSQSEAQRVIRQGANAAIPMLFTPERLQAAVEELLA